MPIHAAVRLTAALNHAARRGIPAADAVIWAIGDDVAHHVFARDGAALGAGAASVDLSTAFSPPMIAALDDSAWVLALPRPGAMAPLRAARSETGRALSAAALQAGAAVVRSDGRLALVPHRVGPAVQWERFDWADETPEPPLPVTSVAEADRLLREQILVAAGELDGRDLVSGTRPEPTDLHLPPGFDQRANTTLVRGLDLLAACDAALEDHSAILHSFGIAERTRVLTPLRQAAIAAVCAAVSQPPRHH